MVSGGEAIAAAIAGLAVTETTGVTDITDSMGGDQDGSSPNITLDSGSGIPSNVLSEVMSASNGVSGGVNEIVRTVQAGQESVSGAAETAAQIQNLRNEVERLTNTDTNTQTVNTEPLPFSGLRQFTNTGNNDGYNIQTDYNGPGSNIVRGTAETLEESGSVLGTAGKFVNENKYATLGVLGGLAAAPVTGGASIPAGIAVAGGGAEVSSDIIRESDIIETPNQGAWYKGPDPLNLGSGINNVTTPNNSDTESNTDTQELENEREPQQIEDNEPAVTSNDGSINTGSIMANNGVDFTGLTGSDDEPAVTSNDGSINTGSVEPEEEEDTEPADSKTDIVSQNNLVGL